MRHYVHRQGARASAVSFIHPPSPLTGEADRTLWWRPSLQIAPVQSVSVGEFVVGDAVFVLGLWGIAELLGANTSPRTCAVCGRQGHARRTCPHEGARVNFSRAIPKSNRCECCGSPRYGTQRHHTRGRSNPSDFLDVCLDCHIDCRHDGRDLHEIRSGTDHMQDLSQCRHSTGSPNGMSLGV